MRRKEKNDVDSPLSVSRDMIEIFFFLRLPFVPITRDGERGEIDDICPR
jgi:hypothetical protein